MNVNEKGVKGMIKVLDDLTDKGLFTFPAFDDHGPIDLIVSNENGKLIRLQVKYRTPIKNKNNERYELCARSIVNGIPIPIDRSLIDGWAIYLSKRKRVIYIHISEFENKKVMYIDPDNSFTDILDWF